MTSGLEGVRWLVEEIAHQKPEKPDYWNSCSQCESNIDAAQEALAALPTPPADAEQRARLRSAAELQKFIDLAADYDLDGYAIGALEAGIEALNAAAPPPAAALEDAREDVERYRHLRSNESSGSADLCICHVRWAKRGGETTEYVLLVENEADAAIDQARGKAGGEVEGG